MALANVIACSITVYVQEKARISMRYDMEENPNLVREALQAAEGSSRIQIFNWFSKKWSSLTRKPEV